MTEMQRPEINTKRIIRTLPPQVANRIAAGEVVERPAAVIKELVENSIDSGATQITIVIEDAGRTLMSVIDNGAGMSQSDLISAIGRHTTSKLTRFEDLESLETYGFRGEALPSIVAVSRTEIMSRLQGDEIGSRLKIAGGDVELQEPASTPEGTTISVGHLFYNVPARRKFLRTDATEFKWIATVFRYFALAFPEIAWKFYRSKELLYDLPAVEDSRERLAGLFGDDVAEEFIPVNYEHQRLKVRGWISPPDRAQRSKDDQYLFMNRRAITHPRLSWRISEAWKPYNVTGGGHPMYIIFIEASPDRFDINVHPAKKEIKFVDERGTINTVWQAIREALKAFRLPDDLVPPSIPQHTQKRADSTKGKPVQTNSSAYSSPYLSVPSRYGASRTANPPFPSVHAEAERTGSSGLNDSAGFDPESSPEQTFTQYEDEQKTVLQIFDTFILSPLKTGVVFIDQHIAHERILYEQALAAMNKTPWESQQLLFPTTFSVNPEDAAMVKEVSPLLEMMGFELEALEEGEFRIAAVPVGLNVSDEREMLLGIIAELRENATVELDPRQRLAAAFSCRGAVKAGQPLEAEMMRWLIDELFRCEDPEFCPHGRPIYHVLSRRDIEKWFKR